jgi:hypothetical protein
MFFYQVHAFSVRKLQLIFQQVSDKPDQARVHQEKEAGWKEKKEAVSLSQPQNTPLA